MKRVVVVLKLLAIIEVERQRVIHLKGCEVAHGAFVCETEETGKECG